MVWTRPDERHRIDEQKDTEVGTGRQENQRSKRRLMEDMKSVGVKEGRAGGADDRAAGGWLWFKPGGKSRKKKKNCGSLLNKAPS